MSLHQNWSPVKGYSAILDSNRVDCRIDHQHPVWISQKLRFGAKNWHALPRGQESFLQQAVSLKKECTICAREDFSVYLDSWRVVRRKRFAKETDKTHRAERTCIVFLISDCMWASSTHAARTTCFTQLSSFVSPNKFGIWNLEFKIRNSKLKNWKLKIKRTK